MDEIEETVIGASGATPGIRGTQIDGDVSVGRNVSIGGKATVAGSVNVGHNLKVEGWLEAPNIKDTLKGLFASEEALNAAYPSPQVGWWALVGNSAPWAVWRCNSAGTWSDTGGTSSLPDIDINIINDLTTGGENNILSAEMGKTLADMIPDIVDDLATYDATKALSAKQGYILNEELNGRDKLISFADLTWTSGYGVTYTGSYVQANYYYASEPFRLTAGDKLSITTQGSSVSVIAKYDSGTYTPIVILPPGTDTTVNQYLTHTIVESGDYVATCHNRVFSMAVEAETKGIRQLLQVIRRRTISEQITLEGGSFNTSHGFPYYPIYNRTSFTRTSHTSKFIKFDSSIDKIISLELETGEAAYIFCYDKDKVYKGNTQNISAIPSGTEYIKIAITHPEDLEVRRVLSITLDYSADRIIWEKNVGNGIDPYYFPFECPNVEIVQDGSDGISTYNGDQTRRFDTGYVMLPPNYTTDGDPVQLILFFHGSGMFQWKGSGATGGARFYPIYYVTADYSSLLRFLCKCGYAVADCCAMTDKYSMDGNYGVDFKCAPIGQSCYVSLYKYIVDNFNIRTDGVYAFGKSAGGIPTIQLAYNRNIPIRAIANMNPALGIMGTFRYAQKAETNWLLGQFGYVDPNVSMYLNGNGDVAYVKANINNIKGWDAFSMGTDLDLPALANAWYKYARLATSMPDLQELVDGTAKYQPIPMKMWASEDDENTPYIYMQMYTQMVRQGNGICILRTMPNGTGKHMCTDGASAIRCDYQTKYGGVVNTTVAFAEMVDWFRRW